MVSVLWEPRLRGVDQALNSDTIAQIVSQNPMQDLFLLVVDRDCDRQDNVAKAAAREEEHKGKLLHCLAWQEVEVWMLALHKSEISEAFSKVREHCDPKEACADPLLDASFARASPREGRKQAMRAIKGKWRSLRDTCPELRVLRERIIAWYQARQAP